MKFPFRLRLVFWVLLSVFILSAFSFLFRAPLLRAAAHAWIVNDAPSHADAIVVLGGGVEYRPFAAARLYKAGVAPKVLVTQPEVTPTALMGLTAPEFVTARLVLLSNGVPPEAIEPLGTNVTSTRDEALALQEWVSRTKAHSVVIPTEIFHTRRVRWIFSKILRHLDCAVHPVPVDPPYYTATNWWGHEEGLIAFQNEVVKSMYYHLKY